MAEKINGSSKQHPAPAASTVTTLAAFDPPGYPDVDDGFSDVQKKAWSNTISLWMTNEINAEMMDQSGIAVPLQGPDGIIRTPLSQFFNGRVTQFDTGQTPALISWIGFPNLVKLKYPNDADRWEHADATRSVMDEYLEWTVKKDANERITSVTFTCEGPEYWQFIAETDPNKLLALYKKLNPDFADQIQLADLFDSQGNYNPGNKWNGVKNNTDSPIETVNPGCITHLVQPNNTLNAEIDIAAQATVIRMDAHGNEITDRAQLINCSKYGSANRNSDPTIGDIVNGLARGGNYVSIANPVALYMQSFDTSSFMLDQDGTGDNLQPVPAGTFTWVRGNIKKGMGLRVHVQVPAGVMGTGDNAGRQMTVADLVDTNNSQNVFFGAQFADYLTLGVRGVVIAKEPVAPALFCPMPVTKKQQQQFTASTAVAHATHADVHAAVAGKLVAKKLRV